MPHALYIRKSGFLVLFSIIALLIQPISFCQYLGPLSAISIDFAKGSTLSDDEVKTAVKLAQKAGITNISRIYSYYLLPTSDVGISVNGAETINGRKITFASIDIETKHLKEELSQDASNVQYSEGEFWVRAGPVRTNILTTFETRKGTIRIELGKKVSLAEADKIVEALTAEKIRFADANAKDFSEGVNLSKPYAIYLRRDGSIYVSFSCGEGCHVSFRCTLQKDEVVLSESTRSVA